jgi:CHASE3 domain sensor protein
VVVGVAAMGINESTYQHSHRTLSSGIALTDARIRSAEALQALTDTDLHARSYLMSKAPQELAKYRETLQRLDSLKNDAVALVRQMDPDHTISLERVERLLADHVCGTDAWVEAFERGDTAKAIAASVSAVTRTRRNELREEFDLVLQKSGAIQENARYSLYRALSLNRLAIHLLALATALALFYFQHLLREEDRKLARERLLLADRVKERTAELTEMATHLVNAREDERAHVARELHDEMGGLLTAMKLSLPGCAACPTCRRRPPSAWRRWNHASTRASRSSAASSKTCAPRRWTSWGSCRRWTCCAATWPACWANRWRPSCSPSPGTAVPS